MSKCDCSTYYFFDGKAKCLHQLFQSNLVRIVVKNTTYNGDIEFYIYRDKPKEKSVAWKKKWWISGMRTRLTTRDQILLAIELAEKHQVRKVRL